MSTRSGAAVLRWTSAETCHLALSHVVEGWRQDMKMALMPDVERKAKRFISYL
jgi:hypothetical protein